MHVVDTPANRAYSDLATANSVAGFDGPNVTGGHNRHSSGFFVSKSMASLMGGPCGIPVRVCRVPVARSVNLHGSAHPFDGGCADKRPHNRSTAMTSIIPFVFQNHSVRVISEPSGPLFVAHDVASALGYSKPENAIARHCKRQSTTPKRGGGLLTVIPESDLYRLIMRSRLASADQFADWVVEEVLPTIRKTGSYSVADRAQERLKRVYDTAASIHRAALESLLEYSDRQPDRLLVSFDENGRVFAQPIDDRALVATLEKLAHMISQPGGVMATDAELALLAQACSTRLIERITSKKSQRQLRIAGR